MLQNKVVLLFVRVKKKLLATRRGEGLAANKAILSSGEIIERGLKERIRKLSNSPQRQDVSLSSLNKFHPSPGSLLWTLSTC